jgi:hypothetical protein
MLQQTGVGWFATQTLIPAMTGLLGVAVGGWIHSHMWLAEASTLAHYPTLVEFVEIWNRAGTLPGTVATKFEHSEKKLYPLYDDLKSSFDS